MQLSEQLAHTISTFQQECVAFTGPYNDAHDRLVKFVEEGATITEQDIEWIASLARELAEAAQYLVRDLDASVLEIEEAQAELESEDDEEDEA